MTHPAELPPIEWISVVIPVKNNAPGLRRVVEALRVAELQSPVPVELVVVDDGSTDDTAAVAASLGARVVQQLGNGYYPGPFLLHVGTTRNAGIRASQGDVVASLDADCRVEPHYFKAIVAALADHDLVALDQRPLHPNPGNRTYKRAQDVVFRIGTKGAAEPSVAFRRSVCPSGECFGPRGYGEIRHLARQARFGTVDRTNPVHTDMASWRQTLGWGILVSGALAAIAGAWRIRQRG